MGYVAAMKRHFLLVAAAAVLLSVAGCVKFMPEEPSSISGQEEISIDYSAPSYSAGFYSEEPETKTYVGTDNKLYWNENDRVAVFAGTSENLQYVFTGKTGDCSGTLHKIAAEDQTRKAASLSANYAVYPYSSSITIGNNETIAVILPQTQTYVKDGFGLASNTMVAVTDGTQDNTFAFKNVGGYLVLKLYGDLSVSSVTIFGNDGEKLSGEAKISASYSSAPTVTMSSDANTSVTIDCGSGVKLGQTAATATEFWFVLPPVTFSDGFTVQVTDTNGKTFSKSRIVGGSIVRNGIREVNPFQIITKAGQFVRTSAAEQTIDSDAVQEIIKDYGYDDIPEQLVDLGLKLIAKNGDIKLNRIVYTTTDRDGNIVEASGMVSYPANRTKVYSKILSVQHYTVDIVEAPSIVDMPVEMMTAFKEGNQIVVESDYLGYGISRTADLQHPYMHNKLTGTVCADLIEAAQDFLAQKKGWNPSSVTIDMVGASQGGAASISLLEEVEKRINAGKKWAVGKVTAASGPHDLMAFLDTFRTNPDAGNLRVEFLMYAIRGLDYGDKLNLDFHNIYAPEVFTSGAFDRLGKTQVNSWDNLVGRNLRKVLHPDFFVEGFNNNPDILKLMTSIKRNSTINYNGAYKKNIVLYHAKGDDTVPYACSSNAKNVWGCTLENEYDFSGHDDSCIEFYVKYIIDYYDPGFLNFTPGIIWSLVKNLL